MCFWGGLDADGDRSSSDGDGIERLAALAEQEAAGVQERARSAEPAARSPGEGSVLPTNIATTCGWLSPIPDLTGLYPGALAVPMPER